MDKIRYRDLQRWSIKDVENVLPVTITSDSQAVMVLLTLDQYDRLVKDYKLKSHDSHREQS